MKGKLWAKEVTPRQQHLIGWTIVFVGLLFNLVETKYFGWIMRAETSGTYDATRGDR